NNCGSSLAPQGSCTIQVTFQPVQASSYQLGALAIADDAPGSPQQVELNGTANTSTQIAPSVSLVSTANPASQGQNVTFTATISGTTAGSPTGKITFFGDGSNMLSIVPVTGNQMTFSTGGLSPGTHFIFALYSGDANYRPTASTSVQQVVNSATT